MHQEGKVKGQGRKERENSSQMRTSNIQNSLKCNPGKPNNQIGNQITEIMSLIKVKCN
jgi:hypothetical protein